MYFFCVKVGIIGGTGLDDPDILEGRTEKYVDTPYGKVCITYVFLLLRLFAVFKDVCML